METYMSFKITSCIVKHDDILGNREIQSIEATFGDDHKLQLVCENGRCLLNLTSRNQQVSLEANGPACDFERAVNLLRLYLPQR
jgi:hypothetical protein